MKKFLRFNLSRSAKEVPLALDAAILASAAIHARSLRRKRMLTKILLSGSAAAAAAVVIAVSGVFPAADPIQRHETQRIPQVAAAEKVPTEKKTNIQESGVAVTNSELLALADTSVLEQESFNLAVGMAEFSFDGDSFTI